MEKVFRLIITASDGSLDREGLGCVIRTAGGTLQSIDAKDHLIEGVTHVLTISVETGHGLNEVVRAVESMTQVAVVAVTHAVSE